MALTLATIPGLPIHSTAKALSANVQPKAITNAGL
jgi:hypothetical protein